MHKFMIAVLATATIAIAAPGAANAAVCKDAKGKFIKCPPAAVVTKTVVTKQVAVTKPALVTKTVVTTSGLTRDKNGRCHYASGPHRGQFAKCG